MTRELMKQFADSFCCASCSIQKMIDCDAYGTSCEQLAQYLINIKALD